MFFKKSFIFFILIILFFNTYSLADDIIEEITSDDFIETSTNPSKSNISTDSKNIIAIDRKTLSVLYEKNAYEETPMASTTKIMTCIVALENCSNLNEQVKISKTAAEIHGSTLGIKENTKMTMQDLLYGLMLRSRK